MPAKFMQVYASEVVAGDVLRFRRHERRVRKVTRMDNDFVLWWEDSLDYNQSHELCAPDRVFDLASSEP